LFQSFRWNQKRLICNF